MPRNLFHAPARSQPPDEAGACFRHVPPAFSGEHRGPLREVGAADCRVGRGCACFTRRCGRGIARGRNDARGGTFDRRLRFYRLAVPDGAPFREILSSAVALGAPAIRVWAGNRGSADADEASRKAVADDALRCADLAAERGISICYEFHGGTLTDTTESALALLAETEHPFVRSLWQPPHGLSLEECLASLRCIMPRLHHVHVFHWWPDHAHRHALADGRERWEAYVAELKAASKDADLLLEFVRGDDPLLLEEDARTLADILAGSRFE